MLSTNNDVRSNRAKYNDDAGFRLGDSDFNTLRSNVANSTLNGPGFLVETYSDSNTLDSNIVVNYNIPNTNYPIYAYRLYFANNNTLTYNLAQGPRSHGFYLASSSYNTLNHNTATGAGLPYQDTLLGFAVADTQFAASVQNSLTYNKAERYGYGFSVPAPQNTARFNNATDNITGIAVYSNSVYSDNYVCSNKYEGFLLVSETNATIENNIICSHAPGSNTFTIIQSSGNTIRSNLITGNYVGLDLSDVNSQNNLVYNNIFSNTINAKDHASSNNQWSIPKILGTNIAGGPFLGGNYWTDYLGQDTDGDLIGDTLTPYNSGGSIVSGGDFLPLCSNIGCPVDVNKSSKSFDQDWTDYDNNGRIDILDLAQAAFVFDSPSNYWDLNLNGKTDITEIAIAAIHFGQSLTPPYLGSGFPTGTMDPSWKQSCSLLPPPYGVYCLTRIP